MPALPAEATAPDWVEITTEPKCPLCEYMLRGLNKPRCPECGYAFEWAEVLEASSKREHSYLFEHHPERNFSSFVRTMWGALLPRRFWVQLHPAQHGSIGRLLAYAVIQAIIFTVVLAIQPLIHICFEYCYALLTGRQTYGHGYSGHYWQGPPQSPNSLLNSLSQACSTADTWHRYPLIWSLVLAWPLVTQLSLQLYDVSMRRAKIKRVHVLRCVLYSFDAVPACIMVFGCTLGVFVEIMASYANSGFGGFGGYWRVNFSNEAIPWMVVIPLIGGYRLAIAYWRYLRFQHVVVVVASSQIITGLALAIIAVFVTNP